MYFMAHRIFIKDYRQGTKMNDVIEVQEGISSDGLNGVYHFKAAIA